MKTILITGVSRGIGASLAHEFLNSGWKVIGTTRKNNPDSLIANHEHFQNEFLDILDTKSIYKLATKLKGQPIDVVLNNAGIFDAGSLADPVFSEYSDIANVFLTNTVGPYILAEALINNIRASEEKLVVSVSSLLGTYQNIEPHHAAHWIYSSSKAALNYAMSAFAVTYPDIKVVLVRPGWTQTDMGGPEADLTAQQAAHIIFKNIQNHREKLRTGEIVGPDGLSIFLK